MHGAAVTTSRAWAWSALVSVAVITSPLVLKVLVDVPDRGSNPIEKGPGNHADQNDQRHERSQSGDLVPAYRADRRRGRRLGAA